MINGLEGENICGKELIAAVLNKNFSEGFSWRTSGELGLVQRPDETLVIRRLIVRCQNVAFKRNALELRQNIR